MSTLNSSTKRGMYTDFQAGRSDIDNQVGHHILNQVATRCHLVMFLVVNPIPMVEVKSGKENCVQ